MNVEPRRPFGMPRETEVPRGAYVSLTDLVRLRFKAKGFSFLPRQPIHGLLSGRHASRLRGRGLDFDEMRRYLPGDDIRAIDWKATARTGRPQVRVYREERDRPVICVVDQRRSMFFGSREATKSVAAAEVAALGCWRVLAVGDRVGAVVFDDVDMTQIRPNRSQRTVMTILRDIVRRNHALRAEAATPSRPDMLDVALESVARVARHDHLVCIVSDGYGRSAETERLVARIARHNDVIACHVSDPLERALPDTGRLVFGDGARQLEVDTEKPSLRDAFERDFVGQIGALRGFGRKAAMPVLPIDTAGGVAEQVRDALRRAPARRTR
jgi:uncharacterized protein (DUF58 family)